MDDLRQPMPLIEQLDQQSDHVLTAIIERARAIKQAREAERKKEAIAAIKRIAKESGLNVNVSQSGRKRGRPAKSRDR